MEGRKDDVFWVQACLAGDKTAFEFLVKKYKDAIYGTTYHYVGNFSDAQDLVQEVFIQAYINLPRLKEPGKFGNWLFGIASNVSKMWLRNQKKRKIVIEDSSSSLSERHEKEEIQQHIRKAIGVLSEKNKLALTLYYINGYSYKEVASFLNVPVTTVEGRLHKARKKLKKELIPMLKKNFNEHKLSEKFAAELIQYVKGLGRTSNWKVRLKAMEELRKAGMSAEDALIKGMSDEDWHIRRWCCHISWEIVESDLIVDKLIKLLDDPNKRVRIHSMAALCINHKRISRDLVPIIIGKLNDKNKYVRRWAALALGYFFGDNRAVEPLLQKLNDETEIVRKWAAQSLRYIVIANK